MSLLAVSVWSVKLLMGGSSKENIEANLVVGEYDAVVKVRVEDISELDKFLTDKLRSLPDVFLTTTMIITREYK